jgi:hypothetical protein
MVIETEVAEQHGAAENHSSGVGLVLALDVKTDVTAAGFENSNIPTHVAARNNARAAYKGSANVGQNATVQIGHDHDIELLRLAHALHGGVIDDHVIGLDGRVLLGHLVEGLAEQAVGQLHDVGLVDARHLLAVVGHGEGEGEPRDALRLGARDDLERLDDAGDGLVLEAAVLALGVLADDAQVDVLVARLVAGYVLDERDGGVDVELLAHGHVEALVARAANGRVQDALEAELVALQGRYALAEELLCAARRFALLYSRDVNLLPLDWDVVGLEDGLDALGNLGTDTVAGDQGYCVLAAILSGLEEVGLYGSEASGGIERLSCGSEEALE